jgi:hypothetical protein
MAIEMLWGEKNTFLPFCDSLSRANRSHANAVLPAVTDATSPVEAGGGG